MDYRNPVYTENGCIDCEIDHPELGWLPFTADPNDVEEHGRQLFSKIIKDGGVTEYVPPPPPTEEEVAEVVRRERDALLAETDWTQSPDVPEETQQKWRPYRQALRDVPQQSGFPENVTWPEEPE